jgi:type I restriction enzyme S subunit
MESPRKYFKLGDIAKVRMGETIIARNLTNDGIPVFSAGSKNVAWGFTSLAKLKFKRGAIVISARGSIGFPKLPEDDEFTATQTTIVVEIKEDNQILPEYLCSFLLTYNFAEITQSAAIPMITVKQVCAIQVPLNSLGEQRRIVAKIKECMTRIDEVEKLRQDSIEMNSNLLDSALEKTLSQLGGTETSMDEVCSIQAKLTDPKLEENLDLLHVGGANIESSTGRLINLRTASEEKLTSSKFPFAEGTVLYNKIRPYLRKVARPDFSGLCSADMYPLEVNPEVISKDFLYYILLSKQFTDYAIMGSNRAGMPKVNRKRLFGYSFSLPTLEEQGSTTEYLDSIAEKTLQASQYLANSKDLESSTLRDSILRKAFAGEL